MAERGLEDATASSLFHCQQTCEKAMKACLCLVGVFVAEEHNTVLLFANHVLPLVDEQEREQFTPLMPEIQGIEWFYIPSRYGVDRYGRVWVREYNVDEARATLETARRWLELCFQFVESRTNITLPRTRERLLSLLRQDYADVIRE
jgi:HEPN domain-containing protein